MIQGLRLAGVEVVECHSKLWTGIEDRVQVASGGWIHPRFWIRILRAYMALLKKYKTVGKYDVLVVGYPGQFDVYLARILTWLRRKPLVLDVLMSICLVAIERNLHQLSPTTIKALKYVERFAYKLPDLLVIEGSEYRDWIVRTHSVKPERFKFVPLSTEYNQFIPEDHKIKKHEPVTVLYYGTFVPSHAVEVIIEAAAILQSDKRIRFHLVGIGPEREKAIDLTQKYGLENVTFFGYVEQDELLKQLYLADICLGVFGTSPQSNMTIQNKIVEGLSMGKAIITGESPAIRKALTHGEHVYLCERRNSEALAEAIRKLSNDSDLRKRLGDNARELFRQQYDPIHIGKRFAEHLRQLV
jgi:glycosyltransferase involved in cell wall biosynthesis